MKSDGGTRDHYVPQMYLKRFARPTAKGHQLHASTRDLTNVFPANVRDVAVQTDFYWGTRADGLRHHHMEEFFSLLEGNATTAFRSVLDSGKGPDDDALPPWPPKTSVRLALSWWISAQILRTVRQRNRLTGEVAQRVDLPRGAGANEHLRYIALLIEPIAAVIFSRPWGIGFSDYCLLTGDVPTVVLNGQDHHDQKAAVAYWDIYLPLDSHRCLYLPGTAGREKDRRLRADHRFKLHPGLAIGLNSTVLDASVRHVFFHPDHDPTARAQPALDLAKNGPQFLLNYDVLDPNDGVQRRWLDVHPAPSTTDPSAARRTDEEVTELLGVMMNELQSRTSRFASDPDRPG